MPLAVVDDMTAQVSSMHIVDLDSGYVMVTKFFDPTRSFYQEFVHDLGPL